MENTKRSLLPSILVTTRDLLVKVGLHPTAAGIVQLAHVLIIADKQRLEALEDLLLEAIGLLKDLLKKRTQDLDAAAVVQLGGILAHLKLQEEQEDEGSPAAVQKFLDMVLYDLRPMVRAGTVSPQEATDEVCKSLEAKTGLPAPDIFKLNLLRELMSGYPGLNLPTTMTDDEEQAIVDAASPVPPESDEQIGDEHLGEIAAPPPVDLDRAPAKDKPKDKPKAEPKDRRPPGRPPSK